MYFSLSPNIQYDTKPVKFPFSQSDYVIANNFFRRFKIDEDKFSYSVFFKKYAIKEGDRWDTIADLAYGSPLYDWVLILTNNVINPQFEFPVAEYELRDLVENPDDVAYYETIEYKDQSGRPVIEPGLKVDAAFYNAPVYKVDTTSTFLPQVTNPVQATATVRFGDTFLKEATLTSGGSGYESTPSVTVSGNGYGASVSATLSSTGTIKRIDITNPGSGYEYPPIITLGGGLAGQSATAEITNGSVTNITLDGVKFDTTNSNQIYEFGNGTTIAQNGTGTGSSGGFDIGSTHLRFGESSGERYVILNPINATAINTVRVYAIRGNGSNGGETPDINGIEDLYIQYQITNPGDAPDPNAWTDLGIVIDAVPNGSGSGVLDNYDFDLSGTPVQASNVYFRLYQPGNSGPAYDHYGILSVTFIGDASIPITDSTITFTTNPLQTTPPTTEATAQIVLGKTVASLNVTQQGYGFTTTPLINIAGGNPTTVATATAVMDNLLATTVTNIGYGYDSATVTLVGGGTGATAEAVITGKQITAINITSHGQNYIEPPTAVISAPNSNNPISAGDFYYTTEGTWRYNGTNWEKQITKPYLYNDNGITKSVAGNQISRAVTNFEVATRENESRREIYILKSRYLLEFVNNFKSSSFYAKSTNYVGKQLKKAGV